MSDFNAKQVTYELIQWIRKFFKENGDGCNAVIGISGGKDSSVVAALCAKALGKDRVFGVLMPQGEQADIDASYQLVNHLGIKHAVVNIEPAVNAVLQSLQPDITPSNQTLINLPARIRMSTLYAIAQSMNGRVSNNCNLSEDYVGYSTRYGDSVGDFSPLSMLTVTEVKAIGYELGVPKELIEKTPIDGLCGRTDEDNLGFSYTLLDIYIRTGVCDNTKAKLLIDSMHKKNAFKLQPMPHFPYKAA